MIYSLRCEFGEPFFKGCERDVAMVKDAMIAYGILERKLHIDYPVLHDFKLPDEVHRKMYNEVIEYLYEGREYNGYAKDTAIDEADNMSDYDLYCEYHAMYDDDVDYEDNERARLLKIAQDLEATFKLEQVLSEAE